MTAEDILFHFIFHYFICCFDDGCETIAKYSAATEQQNFIKNISAPAIHVEQIPDW